MAPMLRQSMPAISTDPPTPYQLACTDKLNAYMEKAVPQETLEQQQTRMAILSDLTATFKEWVHSVCMAKGLPESVADAAGGAVFTSGSYRLGLNEVGMDIDTICVAPRMVTRQDFFETLKLILEDHESIENLVAISGAAVPIITFDYGDVNIDLLFAQLPLDSVPESIDLNNNSILRGLDTGTQRSLNGPRVTNLIEHLVPNFAAFRQLLRCIRLWAKRRGIYSNKMGYLGGINCNLLCAFVCQLYPKAATSLLLERFFFILKDWRWPTPIMLTPVTDAGLADADNRLYEVWDPRGRGRYDQMPILTPAYPSMNSSMSVSTTSLAVMRDEMRIAHERVQQILADGADDWDPLYLLPHAQAAQLYSWQ
jgi:poly(A) polymerase